MALPKVILDLERLKYSNTGIYTFGYHLFEHLDKQTQNHLDIHAFLYPKTDLPKSYKRLNTYPWHKIYLPISKKFSLWHVLHQNSYFFPKKIKKIFTIHDLNFMHDVRLSKSKKRHLLDQIERKISEPNTCAITTISNFVREELTTHLEIPKPISVIYNGVNLFPFDNFDAPVYKPKNEFLFALGTVYEKKNFHVLPDLLLGNKRELIIAGVQNKAYVSKIKETADKLKVSKRVYLMGPIDNQNKYWYLKHCRAFVFPSLMEGFGIPPIEAMLLGKPVFLSKKTALPEIGGQQAYYFDDFDAENMRFILEKGLQDYDNQPSKSELIKQWAAQFSWESATKKYVSIYKQVLNLSD